MAVTKTQIKNRVEENLGLEKDEDDSGQIERHIERIYDEEIPEIVRGAASKEEWTFDLTANQERYTFADIEDQQSGDRVLYSIRSQMVILNDWPIYYATDPQQFWLIHWRGQNAAQEPSEVLVDGHTLTFWPIPDDAYTCRVFVHANRGPFPANGINSKSEAYTIESGATYYRAGDLGMESIEAKFLDRFNAHMSKLKRRYKGNVPAPTLVHPGF